LDVDRALFGVAGGFFQLTRDRCKVMVINNGQVCCARPTGVAFEDVKADFTADGTGRRNGLSL